MMTSTDSDTVDCGKIAASGTTRRNSHNNDGDNHVDNVDNSDASGGLQASHNDNPNEFMMPATTTTTTNDIAAADATVAVNAGGGENDDVDPNSKQFSKELPKWCISIRNCTGIIVVLGIVNTITMVLLGGIGFLLGAILEASGSSTGYRYETLDIFGIIISQFIILGMNLATLFYLCTKYNSHGRDYKAAVFVFIPDCCRSKHHRRKIYPEAVRPLKDVVKDIWNSVPILHFSLYTVIKFIIVAIVGAILIDGAFQSRDQHMMLLFVSMLSCLIWIVVIWNLKDSFFFFMNSDNDKNDLSTMNSQQQQHGQRQKEEEEEKQQKANDSNGRLFQLQEQQQKHEQQQASIAVDASGTTATVVLEGAIKITTPANWE